jgi:hypothetical protein
MIAIAERVGIHVGHQRRGARGGRINKGSRRLQHLAFGLRRWMQDCITGKHKELTI